MGPPSRAQFSMLIGTVTNPYLRPLELNMIQLAKKIEAGADFIQTQPVFDWTSSPPGSMRPRKEGLADKTAILAGVLPLSSAEEAEKLRDGPHGTAHPGRHDRRDSRPPATRTPRRRRA